MVSGLEESVDTPGAVITREADGIVVIRVKPIVLDGALMRQVLQGRFALGRVRAPVLVDTRKVLSMTREAQEISAGPEARPYTECLALLVDKPVTVVLANFFLVIVRPPYPTKMFRREQDARRWLAAYRSPPA